MTQLLGNNNDKYKSIPPGKHYPGMVKRRIPGTDRGISVMGWGPEAEQVAEAALAAALLDRDIRLEEEIQDG